MSATGRRGWIGLLVAAVFAAAAAGGSADASAPAAADQTTRSRVAVIRGDVQIGRFLVKRDGTLDGALRAFGPPTRLWRGRYRTCEARWAELGVRISFYNLGGHDPCERQYGYFSAATIVGRQWQTARSLRIGDPSRKLHSIYSPRRFTGPWAWLLTRYVPWAGGVRYPGLSAKIHHGWVVAFKVRYPAGGE